MANKRRGSGVGRKKSAAGGRTAAAGRGSGRGLTVKVKTAKRRKISSTRWLQRQLNDPYVAEAQRQGYRSRAAFKLIELDEQIRLLRAGQRVVDLGAAPGGWSQVVAERAGGGRIVAVDLIEMEPLPGATCLTLDIQEADAEKRIRDALGGPTDLVLSDMAPATTGHAATDHLRIMALAEAAYDLARSLLAPGGAFVAKVLQGGTERDLLDSLKRDFEKVRHVKPPASRKESRELYVIATGFRVDSG